METRHADLKHFARHVVFAPREPHAVSVHLYIHFAIKRPLGPPAVHHQRILTTSLEGEVVDGEGRRGGLHLLLWAEFIRFTMTTGWQRERTRYTQLKDA